MLFDFGLVVLVWLVQLVIYPSFHFFGNDGLHRWHTIYTSKVTLVVLPLMAGQLLSHSFGLFHHFDLFRSFIYLLVVSNWIITFMYAIPAHQKIGKGNDVSTSIDLLLRINWIRTILWSLIFILSLILHQENPLRWY